MLFFFKCKMDNVDDNKIIDNKPYEEYLEFKYNFINMPWDDRSKKSKAGIVVLLVSIFVATMALVITNFSLHFKGFMYMKQRGVELSCFRVKMEEYPYVARIHSVATGKLLCVGAVVSSSSVLANGVCVKSGPIRLYFGGTSHPRCKKGFSVDLFESVHHDGVLSKRLVLLSSYEMIDGCSEAIRIGKELKWDAQVQIVGRPLSVGRTLSRQHVRLAHRDVSGDLRRPGRTICVKDVAPCPIRAGDLLIQNGKLFGLASTSVQKFREACFADLNVVKRELKELDSEINVG